MSIESIKENIPVSEETEKEDQELKIEEKIDLFFEEYLKLEKDESFRMGNDCRYLFNETLEEKIGTIDFSDDSQDNFKEIILELKRKFKKANKIDIVTEDNFFRLDLSFPFYITSDKFGYLSISKEIIFSADKDSFDIGLGEDFYRTNNYYGPSYSEEKSKNYQRIISQIKDTGIRIDSLSPKENYELASCAEKIYEELIKEYSYILKNEEEMISAKKKIEFVQQSAKSNDLLRNFQNNLADLPKNLLFIKKFFHENRDSTFKEVGEDIDQKCIKKIEKEIIEVDKRRYELHRTIEDIAYNFLFGRGKAGVMSDIYFEINEGKEESVEFTEGLFCFPEKEDRDIYYKIPLGTCDSASYSPGRGGADNNLSEYESYVSEGNSLKEDEIIADKVVKKINNQFPGISVKAKVYITGSFHEAWRFSSLIINKDSLLETSKVKKINQDQLLKQVLEIISEEVNEARKS